VLPHFHPADELLLAYAAGSTREAVALLVATHLALCPGCRRSVALLEALGGELLDRLPPAALGEGCLAQAQAQLDLPDRAPPPAPPPASARTLQLLPRPLRDYVPDIDAVEWMPGPGFDAADITLSGPGPRVLLLRLAGGCAVPAHTHSGRELLLVLEGVLVDRMRYARGDVVVSEIGSVHQPQAEPGPACVCLVVLEGPIRMLE
jgi:putative transcriptional regulator